jgi:D-arabinono-1,4-lactone oxidase
MMMGLGGRPHWAKPFKAGREELKRMYGERMEKFERIRREMDPEGMFVNPWLQRVLSV